MSLVLLKRINDRAKKTYTGDLESHDLETFYRKWVPHWFETARIIQREFEAEGLPTTVLEMGKLINEQKAFMQYVEPLKPLDPYAGITDEDIGIHHNEGP